MMRPLPLRPRSTAVDDVPTDRQGARARPARVETGNSLMRLATNFENATEVPRQPLDRHALDATIPIQCPSLPTSGSQEGVEKGFFAEFREGDPQGGSSRSSSSSAG
jgi:hypothetical protein